MPGFSTIRRGYSLSADPAAAVRELHAAIIQPETALAVFFCSSEYNLEELAAELRHHFAGVKVIGCTTAGEITPGGFQEGSITGFSIGGAGARAMTTRIDGLHECPISAGFLAAEELMSRFSQKGPAPTAANTFALMLIDGLSVREEVILSTIHWGLGTIPLLGGSAGDDMRLSNTFVYQDGEFLSNTALLTLVQLDAPFRVFNTKHFFPTDEKLVVTKADPERRLVLELNAEPAARELARAIGVSERALNADTLADRGLMVKIGGEHYVRSIQRISADGSLTFYSAIEEGVVLTLASPGNLCDDLQTLFDGLEDQIGKPQLVIGFDCVLRRREMERRQMTQTAGRIMVDNNVIGFATYGEQFQAMHLNHTFTGVAIGRAHAV